jgi:YHS domain-containing protein
MARILVWLLAFVSINWILRKLRSRVAPSPQGDRPRQPELVSMVRDPVCGTFLPEGKALQIQATHGTVSFCSSDCRDRYLAQK